MDIEQDLESKPTGVIAWMAKNSVASNMLMFFLLIGGFIVARATRQEVWPTQAPQEVQIFVSYPGAGPDEVEDGILLAVEDSLRGISGIKDVSTRAFEGFGFASINIGTLNPNVALQKIKDAVDRISTFPPQAERPEVKLNQLVFPEVSIVLYGKQSYRAIRALAERMQDELSRFPGVGSVTLPNAPSYEIAIEVPIAKLRSHHLTLEQVAATIRDSTVNIPGGEIHSNSGRILLRTQERRKFGKDFADIPITSAAGGSVVTLGQIAAIRDDFEESEFEMTVDGYPAVQLNISRNDQERPFTLSTSVNQYIQEFKRTIPENLHVKVTTDQTKLFQDRIELLRDDACVGLVLAFILLGLFLEIRVAFWVTVCIPVSMCGAFLFLPLTNASINLVSLFAFLVALGATIDYSIIVGEHIYQKREDGLSLLEAAIEGTREMLLPIFVAVVINSVAFLPMLLAPGELGGYFSQIPIITISVLSVALIEVFFILPSHLALRPTTGRIFDLLNRPKLAVNNYLMEYLAKTHIPAVNSAIKNRYQFVILAFVIFILCITFLFQNPFSNEINVQKQSIPVAVQAELAFGTRMNDSRRIRDLLAAAAETVRSELGTKNRANLIARIGTPILPILNNSVQSGSHIVSISFGSDRAESGIASPYDFSQKLRGKIGNLAGVNRLTFSYEPVSSSSATIQIHLSHKSTEVIEGAARELAATLSSLPELTEVSNGIPLGKRQFNYKLTPRGRSLGITPSNLGSQIRSAFFGAEALREQRGRNNVKVMVRLPDEERSSLHALEGLVVRTPQNGEVFLADAALVSENTSYPDIVRNNGRRTLTVSANTHLGKGDRERMLTLLHKTRLARLSEKYPGISFYLEQEAGDAYASVKLGFAFVLLVIFTVLAVLLRSYTQPLIIMSGIPLCLIGAVIGHFLLGTDFGIMSIMGVLALSGVVLNSSLIMIVTAENLRERGFSALAAIRQAGVKRFRPIVLTTATTFLSVLPLMFDVRPQGREIAPFAISLGFGILFATAISFAIIPAMYLILDDMSHKDWKMRNKIQEFFKALWMRVRSA